MKIEDMLYAMLIMTAASLILFNVFINPYLAENDVIVDSEYQQPLQGYQTITETTAQLYGQTPGGSNSTVIPEGDINLVSATLTTTPVLFELPNVGRDILIDISQILGLDQTLISTIFVWMIIFLVFAIIGWFVANKT